MVRNPRYTFEFEELVRRYLQDAQNSSSKIGIEDLNQHIKANGHGDGLIKGQFNYLKTRFRNGELGIGNLNHRAAAIAAGLLDPSAGQQTGNKVANTPKSDPPGPKTPVSLGATPVKQDSIPARPVKPTPQRPAPEPHPYPKSLQVFPDLGLPPIGSHRKADIAFLHSKRPRNHDEHPGTTHFGDTSSSGSSSPVPSAMDLSKAYSTARTSSLLPPKPPADALPQPQADKVVPLDPMLSHSPIVGKTDALSSTSSVPFGQAGVDAQMKEAVNTRTGDSIFKAGIMKSSSPNFVLSAGAREKLRTILEPVKSFEHPAPRQPSPSAFFNAAGHQAQKPQSTNTATGTMEQKTSQSSQIPAHQPSGSGQVPPQPSKVSQTTKPMSAPGSTTFKPNMLPPGGLTHPLPSKPVIDASQPKRPKPSPWHEPSSLSMSTSGNAQASIASAQEANMRMSQARSFPSSPIIGHTGYPTIGSKVATSNPANVSQAVCSRPDILGPNSGVPNLGGLVMYGVPSEAGGQIGSKRRFSQMENGGTAHGGNSELHLVPGVHRQAEGVVGRALSQFGSYPPLDMYCSGQAPASSGDTQKFNQTGTDGQTAAVTRSGRVESRSFILGAGKDDAKKGPVKPERSRSPVKLPVPSHRTENEEKAILPEQPNAISTGGGQPNYNSTADNPQEDTVMMDDALAGLSKYTDEELSAAAMMDNDINIAPDNNLVTAGGGVAHPQPATQIDYSAPSGTTSQNAPTLDVEPAPTYYVAPPDPGPVDVYLCGPGAETCPISPAVVHFHCRRNGTVIFSGMGDFQAAAIMYQRSEQCQSRAGPGVLSTNQI
ncbi:hypothetical protein MCOR25_003051 [Pyricularia grisea]|nr:hypothetical protein MCOR25_003051 [Pyricularia grisea]